MQKAIILSLSLILSAGHLWGQQLASESEPPMDISLWNQADLDRDGILCEDEIKASQDQLLPEVMKLKQMKPLEDLGIVFSLRARIVEALFRDAIEDVLASTDSSPKEGCALISELDSLWERLPDRTNDTIKKIFVNEKETEDLKPFLSRHLKIVRKLGDPYDPGFSVARPAIISYLRDEEADDRDQITVVGAVFLDDILLNPASSGPNFWRFTPGISVDSAGSSAAEKTSVTVSTPIEWTNASPGRDLSTSIVSLSPRFQTDRDFDREVREIAISWTFASRAISSRFTRPIGGSFDRVFRWSPKFEISTGKIEDPAGNEKLAALAQAGSYTRILGSASFTIDFNKKASFGLDYSHWWNLDGDSFDEGFLEISANYKLTDPGNWSLALAYRNGKKPPAFDKVDQLLFSIGILSD